MILFENEMSKNATSPFVKQTKPVFQVTKLSIVQVTLLYGHKVFITCLWSILKSRNREWIILDHLYNDRKRISAFLTGFEFDTFLDFPLKKSSEIGS